MSALCQKQTFWAAADMSLFDHLVGDGNQRRRDLEAKRFRRLEINDQFECCWLLNRQVGRIGTLDDLVDVNGGASTKIGKVYAVCDEAARIYKLAESIHGR